MFKKISVYNDEQSNRYYASIEPILYSVSAQGEKRCKLYSCKAEIWECSGFLALLSYGTPVALYSIYGEIFYDCLRTVYGYTATSAQHIAKFKRWLAENNYPVKDCVRFTD